MSLDLENGDEALADSSPSERRRAARKAAKESSTGSAKKPAARKPTSTRSVTGEGELTQRLHRTFDRIAQSLDARGDQELAEIVREDNDAMTQGFVSLTRNVKFLLGPFVMLLNLVEPTLAFGRVGRVLYRRWVERNQRIAAERQAAQEQGPSLAVTQ